MRQLLPLAAILVAISSSWADEKINAPVPKAPVPPSIHGTYHLLATSTGSELTPKGGFVPGGGPGGGGRTSPLLRSQGGTATITRSEIVIEGRAFSAVSTTMEYTLDPTKSPITIDVETTTIRGKKVKSLGIVEISGNRLTIAIAKEGGERPKTTDEADDVTVYYFQKAPPPPKVEFRIVAMTVGKEADAEKELNKLANEGFELVTTTNPAAMDGKSSVTTVHFILKRTIK